jgi:hypothetical protein
MSLGFSTIAACRFGLLLSFALASLAPARALVFIRSGDPAFNATPPAGNLAGSGWQYQGDWGGLLGTPVAPGYFLTAKHGGGTEGDIFTFQGTGYATTAKFDHPTPTADLTLWKIAGTFPDYAPLYTSTDEAGKEFVVFGRSAVRGAEVTVAGASPTDLRGWQWGNTGGGTMRWGENQVDATPTISGAQYLRANFSFSGGPNEATLAPGDSGGGVFIQDGGIWKLAGINYGVEAEFLTAADGTPFSAAIFDAGGLYYNTGLGFALLPDLPYNIEASFYSTRVSSYAGWIQGITSVPEPAESVWLVAAGLTGFGAWRRWGASLIREATLRPWRKFPTVL